MTRYICCEDCGKEQAVNIGGPRHPPKNLGTLTWQWECCACGHVWWCGEEPEVGTAQQPPAKPRKRARKAKGGSKA